MISFGYVDFYAKIFLILYTPFENSTTRIAIESSCISIFLVCFLSLLHEETGNIYNNFFKNRTKKLLPNGLSSSRYEKYCQICERYSTPLEAYHSRLTFNNYLIVGLISSKTKVVPGILFYSTFWNWKDKCLICHLHKSN